MKMTRRNVIVGASAFLPFCVFAQDFPTRPIKVITPFPAGTGPDNVMRLVGERLSRIWSVPVIIENRPGGNGWIALEAAKRAPVDGYTLVQVDASFMTMHPHIYKKLPFDPVIDFEPVSPLFKNNYFIVVAADSKWKNVEDLANAARAAKGQLTYGSSGVGSQLHVNATILEAALNAPMTHIPIKDTPQIYISIARGDISWAYGTGSTVGPLVKSGKVKFLAISAPTRHPSFPDVPTIAEAAGPNVEARSWTALFAPAGVPKPTIEKMNTDISRVLANPEIRERLEAVTFLPWIATASQLRMTMEEDSKRFSEVAKTLKISLD